MRADTAPRALLVDALGTLLMLEPPAPLLQDELRKRFGLRISRADAERAILAEFRYYRAHLQEGRDRRSLAALRRRCATALREALPDGARHLNVDELTDALLASLRFAAYGDAAPALRAARAADLRIVVVSNWDMSLPEVLARLELAPFLVAVVTSAPAGVRKPSPAIFNEALRIAGVAPGDAVHVGDSVEEDVAGARNAGVEPILVRRDGGPGPPGVRTIATLAELDWREP